MAHTSDTLDLSTPEIQLMTDWPDSMVEDYRAVGEAITKLFELVDTISAITLVPLSATSVGTKGQIAADTGFIYICINTNLWRRVAISAW